MRNKTLVVLSLLSCTTMPAFAFDLRLNDASQTHSKGIRNVEWKTENIEAQTQSVVFLRARIDKLEKENEQLRNSINQMRQNNNNQKVNNSNNVKIQSLIEANKRLERQLSQRAQDQNTQNQGAINADIYATQLRKMQEENNALRSENARIASKTEMKFKDEIQKYQAENRALKSSLSSHGAKKSSQTDDLNKALLSLRAENQTLKTKNQSLQIRSKTQGNDQAVLKQKDNTIISLSNNVKELQAENRKLGQSLAEATGRAFDLQSQSNQASESTEKYVQNFKVLNRQVETLKKENDTLRARISESELARNTVLNNDDINQLKQQNSSLRKTIKAQNELLLSSDNAAKTAERLLSENKLLKNKLQNASSSIERNGSSAQDLLNLNNKLQQEIAQRDNRIDQLSGLTETVKQLRNENDKLRLKNMQSKDGKETALKLQESQLSLKQNLQQERENTNAYKEKIQQYKMQNQMLLQDLAALQLKEQKMQQRIDNLQQQGVKEATSEKSNLSQSNKDKLTYVSTKYPPVEELKPILNQDGEKINYLGNAASINTINPEDLLSQDLKPLSGSSK